MRDGKAGHKKMKYYSHYKERKITFLDQDLTISENPLFGFKWITNEDLFLAYLKVKKSYMYFLYSYLKFYKLFLLCFLKSF